MQNLNTDEVFVSKLDEMAKLKLIPKYKVDK